MNQELQDKIVNDFPELFINYKDQRDTFWIPDGWFDLVYNLSAEINSIRNSIQHKSEDDFIVVQIKIKFAGLRFYMNKTTNAMDEFIASAENQSYNICHTCGFDSYSRYLNSYVDRKHNNLCDTCSMVKNIIE